MEWINLVLEPTVNLFAVHYGWCVLVSIIFWAIIAGLTVESNDDLFPAGAIVLLFGFFSPIVLTLVVLLLPVILVVLGVVGITTIIVYWVKYLKDKTLGGIK